MKLKLQRAAICCLYLFATQSATGDSFRTVALSGQPAPGANPGENFGPFAFNDQFYGVTLNGQGRVAFRGNLTNTGLSNDSGLWSDGGGSLFLLAREGASAPDTEPDTLFASGLYTPIINDLGQTAFRGWLDYPPYGQNNDPAIWAQYGMGGLTLVAREHAPAPDTTSTYGDLITNIHFNNDGNLAFTAYLSGSGSDIGNRHGLWSSGHGSGLELIAFSGDPAPGTGAGVVFGTSNPFPPAGSVFQLAALNNRGQTAFSAGLLGPGVNSSNGGGIWSEQTDSGLSLVIRGGDPAPTVGANIVFSSFAQLRFNDNERTAFVAGLSGPSVTSANNGSVWKEADTGLTLVAREGDQAAGIDPTTSHANFTTIAFNAEDHVAFIGTLSGPSIDNQNNNAVWRERENGLDLIAREGSPAPGTTGLFGGLTGSNPSPFDYLVLNDRGQVALKGQLRGPGIDSTNDFGIWAQNADGVLTLIVREGDFIDVDDNPSIDDLRQVTALDFFTNPDNGSGDGTLFNNRGQLAFTARFSGGTSGIFVSNTVARLPGDFNDDGTVDAADYIVWRKTGSSSEDYNTWRANFGHTFFTGSGSGAIAYAEALLPAVPEPTASILLMFVTTSWCLQRPRTA
jgi:hypothetical protein